MLALMILMIEMLIDRCERSSIWTAKKCECDWSIDEQMNDRSNERSRWSQLWFIWTTHTSITSKSSLIPRFIVQCHKLHCSHRASCSIVTKMLPIIIRLSRIKRRAIKFAIHHSIVIIVDNSNYWWRRRGVCGWGRACWSNAFDHTSNSWRRVLFDSSSISLQCNCNDIIVLYIFVRCCTIMDDSIISWRWYFVFNLLCDDCRMMMIDIVAFVSIVVCS